MNNMKKMKLVPSGDKTIPPQAVLTYAPKDEVEVVQKGRTLNDLEKILLSDLPTALKVRLPNQVLQ